MPRLASAVTALAAVVVSTFATPALANDEAFFRGAVGQWSGPGEIVAGKYEGTKFVCTFDGVQNSKSLGIALEGSCRVGLFSQPMRAEVARAGRGYKGAFQDGAAGRGLDITSGEVRGDHMVVQLNRAQLDGAMVARLADRDTLAVTVSVKVASQLVPVIGMNLKRTGSTRQSALD